MSTDKDQGYFFQWQNIVLLLIADYDFTDII